jgi:hypothetical protein
LLLSLLLLPLLLLLLPGMLPPEVKPEAGRAAPRIRGCGISTLRQWPRPEHPRIQDC